MWRESSSLIPPLGMKLAVGSRRGVDLCRSLGANEAITCLYMLGKSNTAAAVSAKVVIRKQ